MPVARRTALRSIDMQEKVLSPAPAVADRPAPPSPSIWLLGSIVILLAVGWLYRPTLIWLWDIWQTDPYYGHGPFLPFIAGFLIWSQRQKLAQAWEQHLCQPARWRQDVGILLLGLGFQLLGALADVNFVKALSLPVVLLGVARFVGGAQIGRLLRFPLLYLAMAVPLTGLLVEYLTVPLQYNAARVAALVLGLIGLPVQRVGVNLYTAHYNFVVEVACSGLKTAVTLLTLGLLVAHVMPALTRPQRWLLGALSVPIALLVNAIRIIFVVLLGSNFGAKVAEGFLHNLSGIFMFAVALSLLYAIGTFWGRRNGSGASESQGSDNRAAPTPAVLGTNEASAAPAATSIEQTSTDILFGDQ